MNASTGPLSCIPACIPALPCEPDSEVYLAVALSSSLEDPLFYRYLTAATQTGGPWQSGECIPERVQNGRRPRGHSGNHTGHLDLYILVLVSIERHGMHIHIADNV
jgi:hypothetical protein